MENTNKKPLGVIDALSAGFELIVRRPWLLLIPIALDVFLWLGPQINVKPLLDQGIAALASTVPPDAPTDTVQNLQAMQDALRASGDSVNVLSVLALGIPSLTGIASPTAGATPNVGLVVRDVGALLGLLVPLGLLAALIASVYLEAIARVIRPSTTLAPAFVIRSVQAFGTLMVLGIVVAVLVSLVLIPMTIAVTLLSLVSQGIASFVFLGGMLLIFWIALYLAFALPAIFVSRVNALQAILNSITVFRYNFWSAMGLLFLSYLIRVGFSFIWDVFASNPLGIGFDILANAFLGSGLVAATMLFYFDRMTWLLMVRERIRQQHTQLKG